MLRRLFTKRNLLAKCFTDKAEAAEEQALSKAGFILQKEAPKVPVVKKGIFLRRPSNVENLEDKPKANKQESFAKVELIDIPDEGNISKKRSLDLKSKKVGKTKQTEKTTMVTTAELLKDEIPTYEFASKIQLSRIGCKK